MRRSEQSLRVPQGEVEISLSQLQGPPSTRVRAARPQNTEDVGRIPPPPPRSGVHRRANIAEPNEPTAQEPLRLWARFERIMALLEENAAHTQRVATIASLSELLGEGGVTQALRDQVLECIQSLARRRDEETACCRGLEIMKERFSKLHKK